MRSLRIMGILGLALANACANTGTQQGMTQASAVSDADVGRLRAGQDRAVDSARQELADASDEHAKMELKLQEARNEEQVARADIQAASAEKRAADAMMSAANQSQAPVALARANKAEERAQAHMRAAEARLDYSRKLIVASEANVDVSKQRMSVARARVEQSKLLALQQSKNPAARKYDAGRFQTAVNTEEMNLQQMERKARDLSQEASLSRKMWEVTNQDLQQR